MSPALNGRRPLPGRARVLALGAGALIAGIIAAGTARPAAETQDRTPPAFKGGISLVSIDFQAIGRDGHPVTDLKAADVTLRIGGRARPVESLNLVDVAAAGTRTPVSPLPPPFGTNIQSQDSRAFVLVVDDDSFRVGMERALREAADTFLDSLAPTDQVALVTMPYGGTRVDLTTEQERVRASLAQVVGQASIRETAEEMACRTRRTLDSLAGLMNGFASASSPVTVAFFSASLVGPNEQVVRSGGRVATCALMPEMFQQVGNATAASGARLYIIEPVGLSNQDAGLDHLAGVTGGVRLHLGGTEENAFTRILRETSAFYRLAFEPELSQRNGNSHRVELRLNRPDVTLRVRPSVVIARPDPRASRSPADMLRQAAVFRDLPLRVAGFVSRETGQTRLKVVALAETADPSMMLAAASVGLVDESSGKLIAQAELAPGQLKASPYVAGLLAPPGSYRLRFAATDSQGRMGTADHQVTVELRQAGHLHLSSLLLGLSRGGFLPRLQFGAEPVALAYVDIYGGKPGEQVAATFELARTMNGPAVVTVPGALAAAGDHHSATAAIPIGALSPGDYIVRATIGIVGQPATRVERTLRKVVF
jgi:VWFA-related protein